MLSVHGLKLSSYPQGRLSSQAALLIYQLSKLTPTQKTRKVQACEHKAYGALSCLLKVCAGPCTEGKNSPGPSKVTLCPGQGPVVPDPL